MKPMGMADAVFYYSCTTGGSSDSFMLLVFESGDDSAPSIGRVIEHVAARAPRIPALNRCLREAPLGLEHPSWEASARPAQDHVRHHQLTGASWSDLENAVGRLLTTRVDPRDLPWLLHVITGVEHVPHVQGVATVVVLQISHALSDGVGTSKLLRALFTADPDDDAHIQFELDSHRPRTAPRLLTAILAAARAPHDLTKSRVDAWSARRAYRRHLVEGPGQTLRRSGAVPSTSLNGRIGQDRRVTIRPQPIDVLRRAPHTVTSSAVTATSVALQRYFDITGETVSGLAASVPVALPPSTEWSSSNRTIIGVVDMHADIDDLDRRAHAVAEDLRAERIRVLDEHILNMARADHLVPAPIVRTLVRRTARQPTRLSGEIGAQTNVVSVNRGPANLELCGSRSVFTAGFPYIDDGRGLTHGFFGLGDVVTTCTVSCPEAVPEPQFYADVLEQSVVDFGSPR